MPIRWAILCLMISAWGLIAVGDARAEVKLWGESGRDSAWVALDHPDQGTRLYRVTLEEGTPRFTPIRDLPVRLQAFAGSSDEAMMVLGSAIEWPRGRPPAKGPAPTPGVRAVRRIGITAHGPSGMVIASEAAPLPPLPGEGELIALARGRDELAALLRRDDGTSELHVLRQNQWSPASPPDWPSSTVIVGLLSSREGWGLLAAPSEGGEREVWWSDERQEGGSPWRVSTGGLPADATAVLPRDDGLLVLVPMAESRLGMMLVRGSSSHQVSAIDMPAEPWTAVVIGRSLLIVRAEVSPAVRLVCTMYDRDGAVLFEGGAALGGPVTGRAVEALMVMLASLVMGVGVFVFRTETPGAIAFPEGFALAQPWRRAVGALIDMAPGLGLASWLWGVAPWTVLDLGSAFSTEAGIRPLAATLAFAMIHGSLCEGLWGRTVGKLAVGTRTISTSGSRPNMAQAISRNIVRFGCPPLAALSSLGPPGPGSIGPGTFGTLVIVRAREPGPDAEAPGNDAGGDGGV